MPLSKSSIEQISFTIQIQYKFKIQIVFAKQIGYQFKISKKRRQKVDENQLEGRNMASRCLLTIAVPC